ncbi:MerR family transcriptional regulator [Latilactobacillus fuchuensis]|uniref:HTH merR-type domain-containing protein n=1 Tax=Latilactobacillus fuchuensis DSM 14340 = JCM 11249 TaxID=1423747 RepID=A0A0R1S4Y0_9LACO|nr:MerR family transcriptional regulator [Latilactobacillus fuchuensis]KRL61461.1 hypothetical protein FC69_GL000678 [Latilactobacillus fuchuensis DSM 14340 = JCM 11249]
MSTDNQYSIGQFSKLTGLSPDTLRYYERQHLLTPLRGTRNLRYYSNQHQERIALIRRLKGGGFSIAEIQKYLELRSHHGTFQQRRDYLAKQLITLHERQQKLNASIEYVQTKMAILDDWIANDK